MPPGDGALIFDLDNTLIMSHIDFVAIRHRLIDMLEDAGITDQPRDALLVLSLAELVDAGARASPTLAAPMWEVIRRAEVQGLEGATRVEGAEAVLRVLRARGYHLALLTNNARDGLMERLEALGLAPYFEVVATRDDVPALKPAAGGIRHVLARLPAVRHAYMIGDAWIDAQAAREAGIRFIGVGDKRAAIEARGMPIWAWVDDLSGLLRLELGVE